MKNIFSACVYSHFQFWGMLFCKLPFFLKLIEMWMRWKLFIFSLSSLANEHLTDKFPKTILSVKFP